MRNAGAALVALIFFSGNVDAHVTPNVQLVRRGEFLKESLPGATKFFEKPLVISDDHRTAMRRETGWAPSDQDTRVYVGRDGEGRLVGLVIFLWVSSQHGPLGIGVAFDPDVTVRRVAINDVSGEALPWVRPLIEAGGLDGFVGLPSTARPDPEKVAPQVSGAMARYYLRVIAAGVARAQAIARLAPEK